MKIYTKLDCVSDNKCKVSTETVHIYNSIPTINNQPVSLKIILSNAEACTRITRTSIAQLQEEYDVLEAIAKEAAWMHDHGMLSTRTMLDSLTELSKIRSKENK